MVTGDPDDCATKEGRARQVFLYSPEAETKLAELYLNACPTKRMDNLGVWLLEKLAGVTIPPGQRRLQGIRVKNTSTVIAEHNSKP
jgi:hypothetical protein